ncbi:MAG: four helix bundle protein [Lentisphaeria bacterium]|nr:four helix bundle protein [Lentisphaeria bacterium]
MNSDFEKLAVWKRSCRFAVSLYEKLKGCKDPGLYSQMTRAAVSIPSNIAEGAERKTKKDFVHFLYNIAKGSAAELRTQLYIAGELKIISKEDTKMLVRECKELSKMLKGLINALNAPGSDSPDPISENCDLTQ